MHGTTGLRDSMYELSLLLSQGCGCRRQQAESIEWMYWAAIMGSREAQYMYAYTRVTFRIRVSRDASAGLWMTPRAHGVSRPSFSSCIFSRHLYPSIRMRTISSHARLGPNEPRRYSLWLEQGFMSGVPYPLTAGPLTYPHDPSLLAASLPSPPPVRFVLTCSNPYISRCRCRIPMSNRKQWFCRPSFS